MRLVSFAIPTISSLTRLATLIAATRRGWVQPINPYLPYPCSNRYCVNCVVLPDPVSPTTMTTVFSRITLSNSSRTVKTGKNSRCCRMDLVFANSDTAMVSLSCFFMCVAKPLDFL